MPLTRVKPYAAPYDDIECFEYQPMLSDKECANIMRGIELRRLDINGRSARLRPLVGETDKPELL